MPVNSLKDLDKKFTDIIEDFSNIRNNLSDSHNGKGHESKLNLQKHHAELVYNTCLTLASFFQSIYLNNQKSK